MAAATTGSRHRQHKLHNYTSQNVPMQAGPSEMDHGSCMVDGGQGKQAPSSCLANRSRGQVMNIDVKDQKPRTYTHTDLYDLIHIPIRMTFMENVRTSVYAGYMKLDIPCS
ncbi:hypothetical protein H113_02059 [Trichophyton rubrum MR1459]|nr:hypothetical protein H100_02053 [Trichophyton rubrum MR850]EZF76602.1 hypothetical protein H105_02067 [Trichophyton soudanense CBS 452.61]EZF98070.1 hypothetical protein H113_02059 [Trichophyton rubrum MR1459]KMQ45121.1 hypothetical protein HL42_4234 [Trichophyton rubrum]